MTVSRNSRRIRAVGAVFALTAMLASPSAPAQTIRIVDRDPQQIGTANPGQLGLPDALWEGSSRAKLGEAIDGVGETSLGAAHDALVAMLSAAAAPPAAPPLERPLIVRRIAALARLGAGSEALTLASRTPQAFRDSEALAAEADVRLLRNDLAGACDLPVANPTAAATTGWQKLRAFCSHALGQPDAAVAAAMLGSLSPRDADDTFAALFLALQYPDRAKPAGLVPAKPLHAAMYRFLQLRPAGEDALPAGPAPVLESLVGNPRIPISLRTIAAERALAANNGNAETLAQLYFEGGGKSLGEAYRKAAFAQDAAARLPAVQALWKVAREQGLAAQMAPLTIGMAKVADPAAAPPAFILDALRTALLARDKQAIAVWRDALTTAALLLGGAASRDASSALLALAGERVPPAEQWWAAWNAAAKPTEEQRLLVGGALGALGNAFPLMPSPKISSRSAAGKIAKLAEKAPGEAALRALASLGQDKNPDVALQVVAVRTLARIHTPYARALAVELAAASGL